MYSLELLVVDLTTIISISTWDVLGCHPSQWLCGEWVGHPGARGTSQGISYCFITNFRYLKWRNPHLCMLACKAYVRGNPNPPPKQPYLGQETLHFRYLTKLLVMMVSFGSIPLHIVVGRDFKAICWSNVNDGGSNSSCTRPIDGDGIGLERWGIFGKNPCNWHLETGHVYMILWKAKYFPCEIVRWAPTSYK